MWASSTRLVGSRRFPDGVAGDDLVLARADAVGVGGDLGQALGGGQVGVGARVAGGHQVVGGADVAEQLDQRDPGPAVQLLEVAGLERLDEHLGPGAGVAVGPEGGQQRLLERQADRVEVGRVLGLGVDADPGPLGQVDDLLEGRHLVEAVEGGVVGPQVGDALLGPQGTQLGQGEVLGPPAGQLDPVEESWWPGGRRTRGGRRHRWWWRSRARAWPPGRGPWSRPGRARCSRRPWRWPAGRRPGCARAGSRWRRGGR